MKPKKIRLLPKWQLFSVSTLKVMIPVGQWPEGNDLKVWPGRWWPGRWWGWWPEDDPGTGKTAKIMKTASQRLKKLKNKRLRGVKSESPKAPKVIGAGNHKENSVCGPGVLTKPILWNSHDMFSLDKKHGTYRAKMWSCYWYRDEEIANSESWVWSVIMDFCIVLCWSKSFRTIGHNCCWQYGLWWLTCDLGAYYRVRRMDAIITHSKRLTSVKGIFPAVSKHSDEQ